ncbi:MAG: hypothetical protein WB802_13525, partial [Candidatus Dormiibacterota bacterium]
METADAVLTGPRPVERPRVARRPTDGSAGPDLTAHHEPAASGGGWIRLACGYCGRRSFILSAHPGLDEERAWICPHCSPGPGPAR